MKNEGYQYSRSDLLQYCPYGKLYVIRRIDMVYGLALDFFKFFDFKAIDITDRNPSTWSMEDWTAIGDLLDEMLAKFDDDSLDELLTSDIIVVD